MCSSPFHKLLLLTILGLFLMSINKKNTKDSSALSYNLYSNLDNYDLKLKSFTEATTIFDIKTLITKDNLDFKKAHFKNKQFQYRKKYKRWLPGFTGFKPPVKYIQVTPFNIYLKANYSKPHFLSHLHHFLFRLTPF